MASSRFAESLAEVRTVVARAHPPLPWLLAIVATFLVVGGFGAIPPLFTAKIIDALQHADGNGAMHSLGMYVVVTLIYGIAQFGSTYATSAFRETLVRNLRIALISTLQRARFDDLSKLSLGEITTRITSDIDSLCNQLEYSVVPTVQGLVTIVATAIVMLTQSVSLSLVSFVFVGLIFIPIRIITPRLRAQQQRLSAMRDEFTGNLNENANLSALALLRNRRAAEAQLFSIKGLTERMRSLRLLQLVTAEGASFATTVLGLLGPTAILAIGTTLLLTHRIHSVGLIVAFLMLHSRLAAPFSAMSSLPLQMSALGVLAHRLIDIFSLREESSGTKPFVYGPLSAENVSVIRDDRTILSRANAHFDSGAHVALVGPSGSGKTTLATMFLRIYDPNSGSVSIAGTPLPEISLDSLREHVAIVSQDPLVFDASVLDNLRYTNPGASSDIIDRAIDVCHLRDVIDRLPEGLETRVGQRGFRLSGGERQRICVARALIQRPDILVLDEALSGVDVETETSILDTIAADMKGKTLLVVTHRLASIADFPCIAVLENGEVIVMGDHTHVRDVSPWYRSRSEEAAQQVAYS
ncbi:MAG: ABC transporter ATP-binding protein [Vulcanimicrobiaceae bacterium]